MGGEVVVRKPKIEYTRSREYRVLKTLTEEILPGEPFIYLGRYSWLLSPKKEPLELDILFPNKPLAVEVEGEQHTRFSKIFFKQREDWAYYKECDHVKVATCASYNLPLLIISPEDKIDAASLIARIEELIHANTAT